MCRAWRIRAMEFSAHKRILAYVTVKSGPKRSRKWPNKPKRSAKLEKLLKKVNNFSKFLKRSAKFFQVPESSQHNVLFCLLPGG